MAGAGARTRKDGTPSARVGSIERLAPRQIGPSMPTMREVRALGAAADAASGRSKRGLDLAERAQSARAARTAFMAARKGEAERTRAGTLPARALATQQALVRANEAMKQARTAHHQARGVVAKRAAFAKYQAAEARRARLVQHRDRLLAAHEHRTGEDLHPGYKIGPNGAKHWTMERRKQPSEHEVKAAATRAEKTAAVNADFRQTAAAATAKHNTVIDAAQRAAREKAPATAKPARPKVDRLKQTIMDPRGDQHVSIANAGDLHVVQLQGYRGKPSGEYQIMNPATGRRMGVGRLSREKALALLEAGPTGRTLSRAKVGYGSNLVSPETHRANRAITRYERIKQSRTQAAMTKGPAAPVPNPASASAKAALPKVADANPAKVRADFAEHRAARVEGLEARAARLQGESNAAYQRVRAIGDNIPLGQPILVGHHSERRARADIRRIDEGMRKSVTLHREAEATAARAAAAAKSKAVSSDDPAAVGKLHEKLAAHQAAQSRMTATNKVIRAAEKSGQNPHEALLALGHSPAEAHALVKPDYMGRRGYADYQTKNNSAEMRRTEKRIADLTAHRAAPSTPAETHGRHSIEEGGNRVKVTFAGKPSEATRSYMKSNGFRWSPREGVWQRNTSATAWQHARAAAAMEG